MTSPVVFITGALPGIDRIAAIVFAQEGAQGQKVVAEIQALGAEVVFVRPDALSQDEVRNLADQMVEL
jgi:NAD(P)-dependent dehydrogenase (short-subunit alcohol dehydrogenase family)